MSSDDLTLVGQDPKTILVIFREDRSWLTRWYTWVQLDYPKRQVVKDITLEIDETDNPSKALLASQAPVQKAFRFVINAHNNGDIVCIFGFGERGSSASFQLAHMLHSDLAADFCHSPGTKKGVSSMEESSIVQCVAVNYYRNMEAPLNLLRSTISRLPDSVDRVICTNEDDCNVFACSALRGQGGCLQAKEIWRFDCAPAWRTNRHWLIKQTTDLVRYSPEHVKNWFDTQPKVAMKLERPMDLEGALKRRSQCDTLVFDTHRIHDDHIINILEDDEFDLRYQVWTL